MMKPSRHPNVATDEYIRHDKHGCVTIKDMLAYLIFRWNRRGSRTFKVCQRDDISYVSIFQVLWQQGKLEDQCRVNL